MKRPGKAFPGGTFESAPWATALEMALICCTRGDADGEDEERHENGQGIEAVTEERQGAELPDHRHHGAGDGQEGEENRAAIPIHRQGGEQVARAKNRATPLAPSAMSPICAAKPTISISCRGFELGADIPVRAWRRVRGNRVSCGWRGLLPAGRRRSSTPCCR